MFIMKTDNTITSVTTADNYGYPATSLQDVSTVYYADQFAGVALKGSISGTTEDIPVGTAGVYRYALQDQGGVTVGQLVSGATSAAKAALNQQVFTKTSATKIMGTTIGKVIMTASGATTVDVDIITRFSGVSYADIS